MTAIEIRAGPMLNLYGTLRDNTLHLDQPFLNPENRTELLITLIHEAGARLGRGDEENERFAVECVKGASIPAAGVEEEIPGKEGFGALKKMIAEKRELLKRPVVVGIDGDTRIGKTVFATIFVAEGKGKYVVIHRDEYYDDNSGNVDWREIGRRVEVFLKDETIDAVLIEGLEMLEGERKRHFTCDIRVNMFANDETRYNNVRDSSGTQLCDETIRLSFFIEQSYPFDVNYDLRLNNCASHRREISFDEENFQ